MLRMPRAAMMMVLAERFMAGLLWLVIATRDRLSMPRYCARTPECDLAAVFRMSSFARSVMAITASLLECLRDACGTGLMRERIGSQLEVHHQWARQRSRAGTGRAGRGCIDALDMRRRAVARRHPQAAALPAGIGIIDAAVEALGEETHRIRHAQLDHAPADQGVE